MGNFHRVGVVVGLALASCSDCYRPLDEMPTGLFVVNNESVLSELGAASMTLEIQERYVVVRYEHPEDGAVVVTYEIVQSGETD